MSPIRRMNRSIDVGGEETCLVDTVAAPDVDVLAWSLSPDSGPDEDTEAVRRRGRVGWVIPVGAAAAALAALTIELLVALPGEPAPIPAPSAVVVAAAPPMATEPPRLPPLHVVAPPPPPAPATTVTVTAAAPPPQQQPPPRRVSEPSPWVRDQQDQEFVRRMTNLGMGVPNPHASAASARAMCADLASGKESQTDAVRNTLRESPTLTPPEAQTAVLVAIVVYCPDQGGN